MNIGWKFIDNSSSLYQTCMPTDIRKPELKKKPPYRRQVAQPGPQIPNVEYLRGIDIGPEYWVVSTTSMNSGVKNEMHIK